MIVLSKVKVRNKIPESRGYKGFQVFNYILLTLIAILCLIPMINVFSISLSGRIAAAAGQVKLLPVDFNIDAYEFVMQNKDFWQAMLISFKRIAIGCTLSLLLTILTAYPLSRSVEMFKARDYYVWFIFFTMILVYALYVFVIKSL